jgi:hypothetical protein
LQLQRLKFRIEPSLKKSFPWPRGAEKFTRLLSTFTQTPKRLSSPNEKSTISAVDEQDAYGTPGLLAAENP